MTVHVIQRGNNRNAIFTSDKDMAAFAHWMAEGAQNFNVAIHGWVFMTNHVHLLVTPHCSGSLSRFMQYLGRLYVRYFNDQYSRSGTLFEGRFRSCVVQSSDYFLTCLRYIELNPVRAGMVSEPGDYHWSSYRANGLGMDIEMWVPHQTYLDLGADSLSRRRAYRTLVGEVLNSEAIAKIRHCTNTGLVLGSQQFRDEVAKLRG
jgi:putative transposase